MQSDDESYLARNEARIKSIASLDDPDQIDGVLADEYVDGSRWFEATSKVEGAARARKREIERSKKK